MRILLTGFEPYGGYTENSSWTTAKRVVEQGLEGVDLFVKQLPVSFRRAAEELRIAVKSISPDVVVMLGQSASSPKVRLERIAINMMDASKADNDGYQPNEELIFENAPSALFTNIPVKQLYNMIAYIGVPVTVSNTCGLYVCNRVYYEALYLCNSQPNMKAVFIHLPMYKGQTGVSINDKFLELEDIVTVVREVLKRIID